MINPTTYDLWIEKGYTLFAEDGLNGLQVERIARTLNLNKSGFYHYFGDRDSFIEQLFRYHELRVLAISEEFKTIEEFDPGFIIIVLKYKYAIFFHMQLVRYRHLPVFNKFFHQQQGIVDKEILRTFKTFVGLSDNIELAHLYYVQARDMFYSRITLQNFNEEFLKVLIYEVRAILQNLMKQPPTLPQS